MLQARLVKDELDESMDKLAELQSNSEELLPALYNATSIAAKEDKMKALKKAKKEMPRRPSQKCPEVEAAEHGFEDVAVATL